jgi:hypothetical protein
LSSAELTQLKNILEGQEHDLLLALLNEYGQRWKHSGNQIWSIGVIFIPLSLSGIVVAPGGVGRTCAIAFFSAVLIWIWYWIGQSLRSRLDQDWAVYAAIESVLLKLDPPRLNHGLTDLVPRVGFAIPIRRLRLVIAITITAAWLLVTISTLLAVQ